MPQFDRYIGIDYSGAKTPISPLPGLRVYAADRTEPPDEIAPPPSPRKHWTRKEIAEWLRDELSKAKPAIVGIDHAFSFPIKYFGKYHLKHDWPAFLDDFNRHWPTEEDNTYVDFVRDGACGDGGKRMGDPSWFRLTELWTPSAKSVFRFNVQGQVATSTHAGLPWLRYLRTHCGNRMHFWPFDGWEIPSGRSVGVEVYPSLWTRRFAKEERDGDQHAAYAVAEWLKRADTSGSLPKFFHPALMEEERAIANIEGWILGVL